MNEPYNDDELLREANKEIEEYGYGPRDFDEMPDLEDDILLVENGKMEPTDSMFYVHPSAAKLLQMAEDKYVESFPTVYAYKFKLERGREAAERWQSFAISANDENFDWRCRNTEMIITDPILGQHPPALRVDIYEGGSLSESFRTPERLLELRNRALDFFGEELE